MTSQRKPVSTMTEARQGLANVHSPKLDTLRADISKMATSRLLGLLVITEALDELLDEDGPYDPKSGFPKHKHTVKQETVIVAAAVLAISDEIDHRIPVP